MMPSKVRYLAVTQVKLKKKEYGEIFYSKGSQQKGGDDR